MPSALLWGNLISDWWFSGSPLLEPIRARSDEATLYVCGCGETLSTSRNNKRPQVTRCSSQFSKPILSNCSFQWNKRLFQSFIASSNLTFTFSAYSNESIQNNMLLLNVETRSVQDIAIKKKRQYIERAWSGLNALMWHFMLRLYFDITGKTWMTITRI